MAEVARKLLYGIVKVIYLAAQDIVRAVKNQTIKHKYFNIYFSFGFVLAFAMLFTIQYKSLFVYLLDGSLSTMSLIMLIYVLLHIIKQRVNDIMTFYLNISGWLVASWCFTIIGTMFFIKGSPDYIALLIRCIVAFEFLSCIYFSIRYFYLRHITTYGRFSILFIFAPLITYIFWGFFTELFYETLHITLFGIDGLTAKAVLILTILLINLSVKFTPYERITEVKVAIYLILALSSAVSYCFFLSDYITGALMQLKLVSVSFTYDQVKNWIDDVIRWGCLPYLIGSVLGCFSIELADRNHKLRESEKTKLNTVDGRNVNI